MSSNVEFAENWILENIAARITLKQIAKAANIKSETLSRHFVRVHGMSISSYIQKLRLKTAIELVETTKQNLESIAYDTGYSDLSSLRRLFIREMGVTPSEYRRIKANG